MWPLPVAIVAVSFGAASRRIGRAGLPVVMAVALVLMVSHFLVTNEYYYQMTRNGAGSVSWTDAIFPLNDALKTVPADYIFCVDWGILDSLRLLSHGKLKLREGSYPVTNPELTAADRDAIVRRVSDPEAIFIGRVRPVEVFEGVTEKLVRIAADGGYSRQMITAIHDGFGRPIFEVFRFVPAQGSQ
ncbi:MAG: hypothetical protein P4L56_12760 [Candidatus Sulfopaludibacter sp.]|nr:hypothetical protein [Candidatus Sulfopaludibacter sp.]